MRSSGNTTHPANSTGDGDSSTSHDDDTRVVPALTIVWSAVEPQRVGETTLLESAAPLFIGRSADAWDDAVFLRARPGGLEHTGPLGGNTLSRRQLRVEPMDGAERVVVENVGKLEMRVNGRETHRAALAPGDLQALAPALLDAAGALAKGRGGVSAARVRRARRLWDRGGVACDPRAARAHRLCGGLR